MSLAEIKTAVDQLSANEFAELVAFIRERDREAWERQIDEDFAEGGRLHPVLDEVRGDLHAGRVDDMPWSAKRIGVSGEHLRSCQIQFKNSRVRNTNFGSDILSIRHSDL